MDSGDVDKLRSRKKRNSRIQKGYKGGIGKPRIKKLLSVPV